MLPSLGIVSFSNTNHFLLKSGKSKNMPVTWPPGRERLSIRPIVTGSDSKSSAQLHCNWDNANGIAAGRANGRIRHYPAHGILSLEVPPGARRCAKATLMRGRNDGRGGRRRSSGVNGGQTGREDDIDPGIEDTNFGT